MREVLNNGVVKTTAIVEDGKLGFQYEADTHELLDENARMRSMEQFGTPHFKGKLVARTPAVLAFAVWPNEFFKLTGKRHTEAPEEYRKFRLAKLDDPEYSKLRIHDRKLGGKAISQPQILLSTNIQAAKR